MGGDGQKALITTLTYKTMQSPMNVFVSMVCKRSMLIFTNHSTGRTGTRPYATYWFVENG